MRSSVIVIVGPTASGKTALSIKLAKKYGGEIICADSRTVYKGMDIGTAKPTIHERSGVAHWGLDLVEPDQKFTAADFKDYATNKIAEIQMRENIPFIVGGTGLYVDSVIFDYKFGNKADPVIRSQLEKMSVHELQNCLIKSNVTLPENSLNKRYLVRSIERQGQTPQKNRVPDKSFIVVGISTNKTELLLRIKERAEQIFNDNIVKEATYMATMYGWKMEAMSVNVYPLIYEYSLGNVTLEEAKAIFIKKDWQLVKRQLTWFRRNPYIKWMPAHDIDKYVETVLVTA